MRTLRCHCSAEFKKMPTGEPVIIVIDQDGPVSVTNDADNLVPYLVRTFGPHRIVYRDTEYQWDELTHDQGEFVAFNIIPEDDPVRQLLAP